MTRNFVRKYRSILDDAIFEIYDDLCPDDEMHSVENYIARHYELKNGAFDAPMDEGVLVNLDDFPFTQGRIVILPDPLRIVLQNPDTVHREVCGKQPDVTGRSFCQAVVFFLVIVLNMWRQPTQSSNEIRWCRQSGTCRFYFA